MAAPTQTDLLTLDYAFAAEPFNQQGVATGLDLAFAAEPFDTSANPAATTAVQPVVFVAT